MDAFAKVLLASFGAGLAHHGFQRYRAFKARRRAMHYAERNAGFWTDYRLYLAEFWFVTAWAAGAFSAIVPLVFTGSGFVGAYICLLIYSGLTLVLMRSLNRHQDQ